MTQQHQPGDVLNWDFDSDVFGGQYRLIEQTGRDEWIAEQLEPSDELIAEAEEYYLHGPDPYTGYHDPYGPERREQTRQEAFDEEILRRIERAGERFPIKFVSSEQWNAMF